MANSPTNAVDPYGEEKKIIYVGKIQIPKASVKAFAPAPLAPRFGHKFDVVFTMSCKKVCGEGIVFPELKWWEWQTGNRVMNLNPPEVKPGTWQIMNQIFANDPGVATQFKPWNSFVLQKDVDCDALKPIKIPDSPGIPGLARTGSLIDLWIDIEATNPEGSPFRVIALGVHQHLESDKEGVPDWKKNYLDVYKQVTSEKPGSIPSVTVFGPAPDYIANRDYRFDSPPEEKKKK